MLHPSYLPHLEGFSNGRTCSYSIQLRKGLSDAFSFHVVCLFLRSPWSLPSRIKNSKNGSQCCHNPLVQMLSAFLICCNVAQHRNLVSSWFCSSDLRCTGFSPHTLTHLLPPGGSLSLTTNLFEFGPDTPALSLVLFASLAYGDICAAHE